MMRCWTILFAIALLVLTAALTGCTRMRFVIDVVPGADELTETVVLEDDRAGWRTPKVAMIDVTGLIVDARRPGLVTAGENPVADLVESLRRAEDDRRVRAVLIRINSPGGTVTASDVVYREVRGFRERTGKPVVVLMGDVAASGGFYLACAADEIIAHPTSVTGSIGVVIQTINVADGLNRIGIRAEAITSGDKKTTGSPLHPLREEDRALLQGIVDEFYDNFITLVTERRALSAGGIEQITDGRIVTGKKANAIGLVDRLGDLRDAFDAAKELAEIPEARLVKYHRRQEHVGSAYGHTPMPAAGAQLNLLQLNLSGTPMGDQPGFYYLWDPVLFGQD